MSEGTLEGFRMSPPQERLWSVWRSEPAGGAAYNAACAVLAEGPLDAARLKSALAETVARHEILRTGFERPQGMLLPLQIIGDGECPPLIEEDLTGLGESAQGERAAALLEASAREPFDFGRSPLLRLSLLRLSEERHVLLIVMPALCADHAACQNLVRETARAYEAAAGGTTHGGEEIQYADLSDWQNELLESEETRSGRDYWRAQPAADLSGARLADARGARDGAGFAAATHALRFEAELTRAVGRRSEKAGVSAGVFLQTCWHVLLARLTGRADLVVGVYDDGRKYEELDAALGPFAKFLPAAFDCDEGASFESLLRRADEVNHALGRWQEYFTWEDWAAGRVAGAAQDFFPLCFEYADLSARAEAGGVAFSTYAQRVHVDRFELKLSCLGRGDELLAEFHFDESVYGRDDVERLAARYLALLKSAAADPARPAAGLDILGAEERRRLLVEFNRTGGAPAESLPLVHELIEGQARLAPERAAVTCGGLTLTYGELDARAEQLAARLRETGLRPEGRVGVCLERSAETVVCMLAVLKAGGAYVPLEPEQPAERLAFMLEDAGVAVVLTRASLRERLAAARCEVIAVEDVAESLRAAAGDAHAARPENLAYVLYTSGSTGRPKGVAVEHRQLAHYVDAVTRRLALPRGATFAAVTTLAADLAYTAVFPALSTGGHLHVVSHELVADAAALADYFERHGVDCVKVVPSLMTALLASPDAARLLPRRVLVLGGEASAWELVERVRTLAPSCEVFNHYGPTESTVGVLTYRAGDGAARSDSPTVPLGVPLERVRAYVLDAWMRPVPTGLAGELYLGGAGLARGYLDRPALTAERFVPDPFSAEPGARLYRTGDLVRFLADGTVGFLGRMDDQLKIRGFRVEAGEVEAALRAHPGVRAAVVLPRADASGAKRLVAYFVADESADESAEDGGGRERYRLPNGLSIVHQNRNETDHGYREIFEEQSYLRHGVTVGDGDCVFDVGANIGLFSLFVGRTRPRARVYAFEPVAPVYELLRTNAALHCPNVKALHVGLSDGERAEEFTYYPGYTVMSGARAYADAAEEVATIKTILRNRQAAGGADDGLLEHAEELIAPRFAGESVRCRLRAVSDVIDEEGVERIDLLKVDVQRAELDVLRGIREEHWSRIGQIVMEVHDGEGQSTGGRVAEVSSMLAARGFRVAAEQPELYRGTDRHTLYATRPEARTTHAAEVDAAPVASFGDPEVIEVTEESLTNFLRERLPEYMIPSAFVRLGALPLTPNGKVSRDELPPPPEPAGSHADDDAAPAGAVEAALAAVWSSVLGVERVGRHDNFFRLGGDSIMSIQVVARAGQEGLRITARQLFENPTVAGLAAVANTSADAHAEQGLVVGPLPLTPIQRWFFEPDPVDPHHWNMALMLEAGEPLDAAALAAALRTLLAQHDALRLRFEPEAPGLWRQSCGELTGETPLTVFDLSHLPRGRRVAALEEAAAELQGGLRLAGESLLRCALFRLGGGEPDRLLFVVHHLGIDGVSWRILLEDLRTAYEAAASGARAQLPPKTTSFRRWAEGLAGYAREPQVRAEADYWLGPRHARREGLPIDGRGGENTYANSSTVTAALDAELTRSLLQEAPRAYNTEVNDILLAALARAFAVWTGGRALLVDLEGHGREEVLAGTDFSRTVGCFTTRFPVLLELGESSHPGEELKGVKEQLRRVPQRGIGYGVLRYLSDDEGLAAALGRLPQPEVSFNYLGQLDQLMPGLGPFAPARESSGPVRSERAARRHALEVGCWVADGRLETVWRYGEALHRRETIESLANGYVRALGELVEHCLSPDAGGYSPSDFEDFGWSQEDLNDILSKINGPAA